MDKKNFSRLPYTIVSGYEGYLAGKIIYSGNVKDSEKSNGTMILLLIAYMISEMPPILQIIRLFYQIVGQILRNG
jgi:hypothetical protein